MTLKILNSEINLIYLILKLCNRLNGNIIIIINNIFHRTHNEIQIVQYFFVRFFILYKHYNIVLFPILGEKYILY